jgi:dihydropyrimidinase
VASGRLTPERFVELTATAPADIFGLKGKGRIAIGADADLIVIDPDAEVEVTAEGLHSAVDYSPYEGMRLKGFPRWTVSRGEVVIADGELKGARGRGRLVPRRPIDPSALP